MNEYTEINEAISDVENEVKSIRRPFTRVAARVLILLAISLFGLLSMEVLIDLNQKYGFDFISRFPETMIILKAVTVITIIEALLLLVRVIIQPLVDVQSAVTIAETQPWPAAFVFFTNQMTLIIRFVIVLKICEFI